jgi:hypothetical protein
MQQNKPQGLFDNFEFAAPFKAPLLSVPENDSVNHTTDFNSNPMQPPMIDMNIFDYGLTLPQQGQTVVTVPSPWIQAIESPMGTPMLGTPFSPAINAMMTPMQSPFMGSPYLSPFDAPLNQPMYQDPSMDISNWWSQNGSLVDTKPFTELLAESGLGLDLSSTVPTSMTETSSTTYEPSQHALNPATDSVPDGRFWKTIKSGGQTLYQCPFQGCEKSIYYLM